MTMTAPSAKVYRSYRRSGANIHNLGFGQYRAECVACPGSAWSPPGGSQWEAEAWAGHHQQRAHAGEPRVAVGAARTAVAHG